MNYIPEEYTVTPQVTPSHHATKKKRNLEEWAKAKWKKEKHDIRNKCCVLSCQHNDKPFCKLRSIDTQAVYAFHNNFLKLNDVIQERVFLQKPIAVSPIKRFKQENRYRSEKKYNFFAAFHIIMNLSRFIVNPFLVFVNWKNAFGKCRESII